MQECQENIVLLQAIEKEYIHDEEKSQLLKMLHIFLELAIISKDTSSTLDTYENIVSKFLNLYDHSNNEYIRLKTLRLTIFTYWTFIKNYELAFEYSFLLNKEMQKLSSDEFPDKAFCYLDFANKFFSFQEYKQAIFFYNKIFEEKETLYNKKVILAAYNGLGLSYQHKNELEKSTSYFEKILSYESELDEWIHEIWEGIAKGNIGQNLHREKKPDEAIPLLETSMEKTVKYRDFAYASGSAITLAEIYLEKGDKKKALHYADIARHYESLMPRQGRMKSIFIFFSKYYAAVSNAQKTWSYIDSALIEEKKYNDEFSSIKLLRVEQRLHLLQQREKENELQSAKIKLATYRKNLIVAIVSIVLIMVLLFFVLNLYRKKRAAYRILVKKNQQWAASSETNKLEHKIPTENTPIDKNMLALMENLYQLLETERIYKNQTLSIQELAEILHTNRTYLSKAINMTTGNNFNTFINEFRIKEAINMLSIKKYDHLSIDFIAEETGFTNRSTFSIAFKKSTGISPSQFKHNRTLF